MKTKFKKIMVPTDFSKISAQVAGDAIEWAQEFDAALLFFHVIPDDLPTMYSAYSELETARVTAAEKHFKEFVQSLKIPSGIKTETRTVQGSPADCIAEAIQKENVDLVMIATHGRTGVPRFMLGSVTEKVVRMATCPVFVTRSHHG